MSLLSSPRKLLALAALAATSAGAAVATAQTGSAPPTVRFVLGAAKSTPTGPATVPAGAVRFIVTTKAKGEHAFQLVRVADGADVAALRERLRTVTDEDAFEAIDEVSAVGGGFLTSKSRGDATYPLTPGTYLFADLSDEKVTPSVPFTVGAEPATGAALPKAAGTLTFRDFKFALSGRVPSSGSLRLVNRGKRNHILVNFKAQNAAGAARLVKALKANNERAAGKEIRGQGPSANIIGPGESQNLRFAAKPGSYVFVCFYGSKESKGKSHNALGMAKAVTVK